MKASSMIRLAVLLFCIFVAGKSVGAASFAFTRNLTLGTRGNDVSALQQFLITEGFLKITAPTGYFGPLTRTALGTWQASVSISPSAGFFGPISREKIKAITEPAVANTSSTPNAIGTSTAITVNPSATNGSPVRLTIPKIGVDAGFQYLGFKSDGSMDVPSNIVDVGWFTGSPRPGEKGNAIVTGHVVQIRGGVVTKPGVFKNLNELQAGDKLYVLNDRKESISFVVRETRLYDPTADATDVFTSKDDLAHLVLITCEGTWNAAVQSYSKRLVVFADAAQ